MNLCSGAFARVTNHESPYVGRSVYLQHRLVVQDPTGNYTQLGTNTKRASNLALSSIPALGLGARNNWPHPKRHKEEEEEAT